MPRSMTRRKFLRQSQQAMMAGGAAACGASVLKAAVRTPVPMAQADYYRKLGVTPFINAAGTYTILSASTMPDEVQAAVALASRQPVHLNELLEASGEYLARRLRCEAALITAG